MSTTLLAAAWVMVGVAAAAADNKPWFYGPGVNKWGDNNPICKSGTRQSPVDIAPATVDHDDALTPFIYTSYDEAVGVHLQNDGHTVKAVPDTTFGVYLSGGGLNGTFQAFQLHFHWGSNSSQGSEHRIDSIAYPMEVHIVHWNTKYTDLNDAINRTDGLAVLGAMFVLDLATSNTDLEGIVNNVYTVRDPESRSASFSLNLGKLLPKDPKDFYRYDGSLTTPGCFESVTWTLFRNPIPISETQLNAFRSLKSKEKDPKTNENLNLQDNFRPLQERQGRRYTANFLIGASPAHSAACTVIAAAAALSVLHTYSL